jgi:hypothetical protein
MFHKYEISEVGEHVDSFPPPIHHQLSQYVLRRPKEMEKSQEKAIIHEILPHSSE